MADLTKKSADEFNDKRAYPRYSAFPTPLYCFMPGGSKSTITVNNISLSGIGMYTMERMYEDEKVILEIMLPDDDIPMSLTAEVIWVTKVPKMERAYLSGVKLLKIAHEDKRRLVEYINSTFILIR